MFYDIVCPRGNEDRFVNMAKSLGYEGVCFLYEDKLPSNGVDGKGLEIFYGIFTDEIKKARKSADFVVAKNAESIRKLVEKDKPDVIFGVEMLGKKDFMHQRNSGVDHVICNLAKKKGVGFGFSLKNIIDSKCSPLALGRVMQNIILFEKYGIDVYVCSMSKSPYEMRNPRDICALFAWLGMKKPKEGMQKLGRGVERNKKTREGLAEDGVEIVS